MAARLTDRQFQSTLPVWGATGLFRHLGQSAVISIHAPRVGSDLCSVQDWIFRYHFNPRSPCGERHFLRYPLPLGVYFNPRSPCGERPTATGYMGETDNFNPRSPCGERPPVEVLVILRSYFNPRSPCGERPRARACRADPARFQSTLPVWGATR